MTNVYLLLGGLFSWDGPVSSAGMFGLASQLRGLPGVSVTTYNWGDWQTAEADIRAAVLVGPPFPKIAIIGFSGGGTRATYLANSLAYVQINLMVLYDPSPSYQMEPIGQNVRKAISYTNSAPWFFGYGGGVLTGKAPITLVPIAEWHMSVQADQNLHGQTVAAVEELG